MQNTGLLIRLCEKQMRFGFDTRASQSVPQKDGSQAEMRNTPYVQ